MNVLRQEEILLDVLKELAELGVLGQDVAASVPHSVRTWQIPIPNGRWRLLVFGRLVDVVELEEVRVIRRQFHDADFAVDRMRVLRGARRKRDLVRLVRHVVRL